MRQGLKLHLLSRLFEYYSTRQAEGSVDTDSGGTVRDAIKALAQLGCPPETDWPYDVTRFAEQPPAQSYVDAKKHMAFRYQSIDPTGRGAPMRTALASGLAIAFGFSVPQSFEDG